MYIKRELAAELKTLATQYPVVTVIGPRQSGKTTLTQECFPDYTYCSLEDPDIRAYAATDARGFLKDYPNNVIFDEIQRVPELLSYIQGITDRSKEKGQFILTGSHQMQLRAEITQSLAGRTALLTLLPLSLYELKDKIEDFDRDAIILKGFFPRVYNDQLDPTKAYANYYHSYIEKDVRQIIHLKEVSLFEKFIKLLAGRAGQIINYSSLASDVGTSSTTIKEWLSVLESSFIVFKLNPYYENFGKRIIKSPKYYFVDTGLLCYLLNIEDAQTLRRDPLIGNIFENFVVMEAMKSRLNKGKDSNLFFFRDSHKNEVDLLYKKGRALVPIEIKSAETYHPEFAKGIEYFQKTVPLSTKGCVVYSGNLCPDHERFSVIHFKDIHTLFS